MAIRARHLLPAGAAAAVLATVAIGACTAFNDATVTAGTSRDGGSSDGPGGGDTPIVGPDGTGGPDAPSTQAYLSADAGASLCATVFACPQQLDLSILESIDVPIDPNNFSLCMEWATGPIPPDREGFTIQQQMLTCMAQAPSCLAAAACTNWENLLPGDPRCPGPPGMTNDSGTHCDEDGGAVVFCNSPQQVERCYNGMETPGASCYRGNDGTAQCALSPVDAGCTVADTCQSTYEDYCAIDGMHFRINCSTVGALCTITDAGYSSCGASCTILTTECAGASVQVCDGLETTFFDCAALGAACANRGGAVHCARPADVCSPADPDINVCTGTSISLCVGGQRSTFDCAGIGKQCVPGMAPQTAHCG